MTTIRITAPRRVLADVLPGGAVGLSAQVAVPPGFTPVPLTGQTPAGLLPAAWHLVHRNERG